MNDLAAKIRGEQRQQWEAGNRIPVESYLEQYPHLRNHTEVTLDLIYSEMVLREQLGEVVQAEEYSQRFPEFAAQLRKQLEFDKLMQVNNSGTKVYPTITPQTDWPYSSSKDAPGLPRIPGYEAICELGRGGRGVVFKARQLSINRLVAIKVLSDSEGLSRREAETAGSLNHPHIVGVHDCGEHDGRWFIAMEYIDGGSLQQKLANGPLQPRAAAEIVETLARALHIVHQRGIIHRDLKPANVLLTAAGIPKVADFGLAKRLDAGESLAPQGTIIGTVGYMAPEQASGVTEDVTPAADIFALGVILYEALAGRPAFRGRNFLDTLNQMRNQDPPSPRRWQRSVPVDLETICLKCLNKNPRARYQSAEELAGRLRLFLDGKPIPDRPRSWARRRPLLAVALLLLALSIPVGLLANHYLDPERPRKIADANLSAGRPAGWEPGSPVPGPFRWTVGQPGILSPLADGNGFTAICTSLSLLEFVSDPHLTDYRFSAEMRHDAAHGNTGRVGIYFAHHLQGQGPGGNRDTFFTLSYSDKTSVAPRKGDTNIGPIGHVQCQFHYFEPRLEVFPYSGTHSVGRVDVFTPAVLEVPGPWRRLVVEVAGGQVRTFRWVDGADGLHNVSILPFSELIRAAELFKRGRKKSGPPGALEIDTSFYPLAPVGLYINSSTVSVRKVILEPLPGHP